MVDNARDSDCFYCENGEKLNSLMTKVCDLKASTVYLFHDQKHPGRCVVTFNGHKTELFLLSEQERRDYCDDVSNVARVIYEAFEANKINYATYGDLVPHLHTHLVPKRAGELSWGVPFSDGADKVLLSDDEKAARIAVIRKALGASSINVAQ